MTLVYDNLVIYGKGPISFKPAGAFQKVDPGNDTIVDYDSYLSSVAVPTPTAENYILADSTLSGLVAGQEKKILLTATGGGAANLAVPSNMEVELGDGQLATAFILISVGDFIILQYKGFNKAEDKHSFRLIETGSASGAILQGNGTNYTVANR